MLEPIAFSSKDDGRDAAEGISPTLRAMEYDRSHLNGGGQVAIAFHQTQDPISGDVAPSLGATSLGMGVAYPVARRGRDGTAEWEIGEPDCYNALRAGDGGSSRQNGVITPAMQVRRLTPRECERLMGWPDDHTATGHDGRAIPDSHRYRMCGNGVVAPVAEWIGLRIIALARPNAETPIPVRPDGCVSGAGQTEGAVT